MSTRPYGFTKEELEQLDLNQLIRLAGYYQIPVPGRKPTRQAYINAIWDVVGKIDASVGGFSGGNDPNVPKYSVRLQRIMDMKEKEGKNV